ncbi:hypothetical protein SDJN02_23488, partial [Cucurbita argyrosperma subsp. argyrosperma]
MEMEFHNSMLIDGTAVRRWENHADGNTLRRRNLQKLKKEFEAWQAARFRECSRVIEISSMNRLSLAQENLVKKMMALNANECQLLS